MRALFTAMLLAGFAPVLFAQAPPKAEEDNAERRGKLVEDLVTANRLIAFGKGEFAESSGLKDYQSPEALIAAGGILLRVAKEAGSFEVVNEKGEPDTKGKANDLAAQAKELFAEARNLVKGNKARQSEIEELIKLAEKVEDKRGAVGRPRTITRTLAPGESVDITIGFQPGAPASVSYTSTGGGRQRCEIIGPNGRTIYDNTGNDGTHNWRTAGDDKRMITIRVSNPGKKAHTVTVTTN
jgi:hypothetical protein